ncbi:uncharacterized protein TRUGW13939_08917 [Talaromyces rugulosus]|uniref:SMP-30/Gluconolactonase/LRE-like region domain-containing protein n=1 Tax=Talaromyces rugulosus TaxID=121627 RepID=A0A7H8R7M5_TALRU|nr:uncharacterized protein TRUGW13939_08917 [Talaromyces rugulosus]QKX61761.1 hypothetical protein TRUGW13939_08917 [Talaromyces rugulosus]
MEETKATEIASFPPNYLLENIVVRHDGSIIITAYNQRELYYLTNPDLGPVKPRLIHTFEHYPTGIVEGQPDVFYISTITIMRDKDEKGPCRLYKLDMRKFKSDKSPIPELFLTFPAEARGLNGSCALSRSVFLLADSWSSQIWRVDIPEEGKGGGPPSVRSWHKHDMMDRSTDPRKADVPGVNGIKYHSGTHHVYFTTTSQTIFASIKVNPDTLESIGDPVEVTDRWMWADDFIIDEIANVAYVTTHRQNSIEQIDLKTGAQRTCIGTPVRPDLLLGPTCGAWTQNPEDHGRRAYFLTEGGHMNPYEGVFRNAKVLRVEFSDAGRSSTGLIGTLYQWFQMAKSVFN